MDNSDRIIQSNHSKKNESIFVLNESASDSTFLSDILSDLGYQVYPFLSIDTPISELIEERTPDLILIGFNDSDLCGIDICKKIKLNQQTKNIPIIFISSRLQSHSIEKAFLAGGFDYITKPFHLNELSARVENALNVHRRQKQNEDRLQSLLLLHENRTFSEKDLLDYALEEAVRLTSSKCGYLHFVDDDEIHISLNSWSKETLKLCKAAKTPHYPLDSAGIWADCVRHKTPVIHNDYPNNPDKKGYPEGHFPIKRHMSVPVFDGTKIVAIIGVGNKDEPYDDADKRQLNLFFASTWDIIKEKRSEEENKRIHAQLQQAQKMEAIGTLAGGIAHDFNNILTGVIGYTELAQELAPGQEQWRSYLAEVLKAGNRAKELVSQILTFSHQSDFEFKPLELHYLVKEALKLLRSSLPTTIEIRKDIDTHSTTVLADPTQIHQVVMNLCTNSYHAMREKGGILGVSVKKINISSEDIKTTHKQLKAGSYVRLSVSDSGSGIDPLLIDKVFEPYFSTKKKDEGTGLGLALVLGIVQKHGGQVSVYSEKNQGTTFNVYIPCAISEVARERHNSTSNEIPHGHEHILIVDDEESIVNLQGQMLLDLGYHVTKMTCPQKSLKLFTAHPHEYDLIITDMTMPSMNGADLSQRILTLRPGMPIILCTGFSDLINSDKAKAIGIKKFLVKPASRKELASSVRTVLDAFGAD